jgi:hypothetical protein
MQQRCRKALRVHVHVGEDAGHRERVTDVRVAVLAELAFVRFAGEVIGVANEFYLFGWQVAFEALAEALNGGQRTFPRRALWAACVFRIYLNLKTCVP